VGNLSSKNSSRLKRQQRVRRKIRGSSERPRLNVFKSSKHIHAQLIDDEKGVTLLAVSTITPSLKSGFKYSGNIDAAKAVGSELAKLALKNDITTIVFDRNGFLYHGRVRALAEAAREQGLSF